MQKVAVSILSQPPAWRWYVASAVVLIAAATSFQANAAAPSSPLAGLQPLLPAELAALRGGYFGADGLEISFGVQIDLNVDNRLLLSTFFNSHQGRRHAKSRRGGRRHDRSTSGLQLSLWGDDRDTPSAGLKLMGDGAIEVLEGAPEVIESADGRRYQFADQTVAELTPAKDGYRLTTNGDLPVSLIKTTKGLELTVGDEATTLIKDLVSPQQISSQLANRLHDTSVTHRMTIDISVDNFRQMDAARKSGMSARRIQRLVNRGVLDFGARR